jgi:hypothetical protein
MPYGIKNETPEMTKWMENCVDSITGTNSRTGKPYKEGEKIAICKWNLKKHGMKKESSSELSMREELWDLEKKIRDAIMGPSKDVVSPSSGPWVADIFDEYVIVEHGSKLFKVPYTIDGDAVSVDWAKATQVERKTVYEPTKEESSKKTTTTRIVTYGGRTLS